MRGISISMRNATQSHYRLDAIFDFKTISHVRREFMKFYDLVRDSVEIILLCKGRQNENKVY